MRQIDWHSEQMAEVLKYCISGGLAVLMHWAVYALLLWIGVEVHVAYTLGYATSWFLNFFLNSRLTFHSKPNAKRAVGFGLAHFLNYLLEMGLLEGFLWLGIPKVWAYVPIQLVVVPITFVMVRYVFRSRHFTSATERRPPQKNL
ncbi:MAG: GtrA family protein [Bacteroidaceae bacterium]|nr:GtrA family protein [Bacteroidaceae bacterium]